MIYKTKDISTAGSALISAIYMNRTMALKGIEQIAS